ncbi:hypothetical protein [Prevotella nigrescens]|uniref:hypothetical protein n=1 Tax=Prevotella nigrescens TaxID=28133 RepID=UPI0028E7E614|nr:hypothetical protein [Prevotella nigrescens]
MKNSFYYKSVVIAFSLVILLSIDAKAQSKFHVDLDYHYYFGLAGKVGSKTDTRSDYNMGGNSLTLAARYDVHPKVSVGAGVGLARYTQRYFNTLPIYATLRYKPIEKVKDAYVFTDLGYAIDSEKDDFTPGVLFNLGVGYTKMFAKHFGVNFQLGYNLKQFKYNHSNIPDLKSTRHSVIFGVGLTF